jgi:hypothetical protein
VAYSAVTGSIVAIPSIAATPSSLFPIPSIDAVQGALLVRSTERSLFSASTFPLVDTVEISATGRLLSSVAEIVDVAEAAELGATVNTESVVGNVQDFVDSVNAVSLDNEFALSDLLNADIVPAPTTPQAEALRAIGINVLPFGSDTDSFILSLDAEVLENALTTNPVGTTEQLAAATAPIAAAAVAQTSASTVVAGSLTQETLARVSAGQTGNGLLTPEFPASVAVIDSPSTVVPDLTLENAELRRALADTLLSDIVNTVTTTADIAVAALPIETTVIDAATLSTPPLVAVAEPQIDTEVEAQTATPPQLPNVSANVTVGENTTDADLLLANSVLPVNAAVDAQTQTVLALANLPTPLEQTTLLAANPTVAGAVAAFQVPADDGTWAARVKGDLDVINPMAAVLQTQGIAPNLANSNNERQETLLESRVNQWLATSRTSRPVISVLA